jgi:hypothetical protein
MLSLSSGRRSRKLAVVAFWTASRCQTDDRQVNNAMTSTRIAQLLLLAAFALVIPSAGGCAPASAVAVGQNTALDAMNLEEMTDKMAASIAADPEAQAAVAKEGTLKIVIQPVENRMTGEILPRGQAEAFTARVRALLSEHAPERYTWIMNRETFYRLRGTELESALGPAPDAINPRYALWGHFYTLTDESSKHRTSAYLCVFELTDLDRRNTLWRDSYQVKKTVTKGFLDS